MTGEMNDDIEETRKQQQQELNAAQAARSDLETRYGQVWDTDELTLDFEVLGFMAPYCVVRRRLDDQRGSLEFQHRPRFYFNFREMGN